ncbi:methyltransferase domain-containing protein [Colletotrichum musicola]|uniref:Methyltransferase domain-containing protein n=1 Tax=Colletotrichum musicola TaxID=2175873 RepID=A0A8H6JH88_9PEZI|nr:methyltransferase domain-containing protein [Colletotrichum musicola]
MCADNPNNPNIRPDDIEADDHSDISSIHTASTASLSESIREYRQIHGRTFTQRTEYWGPNDERASESLDFNHFWMTDLFDGKLFHAPIEGSPQRVLDMGCGTGIWSIDMADTHPSTEVTGVDLSPIQPSWVPPNCKFVIDDFEQEWTWPDNHFDFIFGRNLEACFADLPSTMKEAFKHTKPGGYIEMVETDSRCWSQAKELPEDHIYTRWHDAAIPAANSLGKPGENAARGKLDEAMLEAGYVDLVHLKYKVPVGGWGADPKLRRIGHCVQQWAEEGMEGFGLYLLKEIAGLSYAEIQVMFAEHRAAYRDYKLQSFFWLHVVYARKPESSEETETAPAPTD